MEDIKALITADRMVIMEAIDSLSAKMDILMNSGFENNKEVKKLKMTASQFLKSKLTNNLVNLVDTGLYDKEDIETLKKRDEVINSKSETTKCTKIISLLLKDVIKKDKEKSELLKQLIEDETNK